MSKIPTNSLKQPAKKGEIRSIAKSDPDGTVPERNRAAMERSKRLREAIGSVGSQQAVADRARVPLSSLRHYLTAHDMPTHALIAFAEACKVSLEWLATGKGPMRPGDRPAPEPPPPVPDLATTLDMGILADCIEAAFERLSRPGRPVPWLSVARVTALIYNEMVEIEARERAETEATTVNAAQKIEP
ncbi:MAG TPA: helix-turn-helix domain-containing protein [Acidisoma sp.]|jgi:hypothetical protein|nr:helix-turn-helix domain-containing protein [Acidisoma sp.]